MDNFDYKDSKVHTSEWTYQKVPGKKHVCFCCGNEIKNREKVIGLINNGKYIPNLILHQECFYAQKYNTDGLCDDISKSLEQYKKLDAIFGNGYC